MSVRNNNGEIKQIIVITDGKSNIGVNPVEAAAKAFKTGIVVSSIAIIDKDNMGDEKDIEEVEGIAKAGGGLCEYTHLENLGATMQLMTQKTAQKTIEQIVSRQLKSIVGVDMNNLEPQSRFKIVDFIEKYGDSINLKCIIALDTSGSMKYKLNTAKNSLYDLLANLQCRKGQSSIAVISYPGNKNELCSTICSFTDNIDILKSKVEDIKSGGGTPTGPAIEMACELMLTERYELLDMGVKELPNEIERYYV